MSYGTIRQSRARGLAAALLCTLLAGCAGTPRNPDDPLEGYNRAMFSFNEKVDQVVLKPVARGYDAIAPVPVRAGVGNFFGNIDDLWTAANNLLQGKPAEAVSDLGRVAINTTLGILGVFDIATEMGFEKHDEDFGQTLGRWGVGEGAYFVLPIFGPRTIRDGAAFVVDRLAADVWTAGDQALQNAAGVLRVVHTRANLLPLDKVLDEGATDRYEYVREAYLQRRRYEVYDGRPPRDPEDEGLSSLTPGLSAERSTLAAMGAVGRIELARIDGTYSPGE